MRVLPSGAPGGDGQRPAPGRQLERRGERPVVGDLDRHRRRRRWRSGRRLAGRRRRSRRADPGRADDHRRRRSSPCPRPGWRRSRTRRPRPAGRRSASVPRSDEERDRDEQVDRVVGMLAGVRVEGVDVELVAAATEVDVGRPLAVRRARSPGTDRGPASRSRRSRRAACRPERVPGRRLVDVDDLRGRLGDGDRRRLREAQHLDRRGTRRRRRRRPSAAPRRRCPARTSGPCAAPRSASGRRWPAAAPCRHRVRLRHWSRTSSGSSPRYSA